LISLILPFWLVRTMVSWRETWAVWPALAVIGGAFAAAQFCWSNFVQYELVDIIAAVTSLAAGVVVLRFWKPKVEWRFEHDEPAAHPGVSPGLASGPWTAGRVARAWMPFALLTATVLIWGVPAIKARLDAATSSRPAISRLHLKVLKGEAVVGPRDPARDDREKAEVDIVPISSTGTAVFLAALLSGLFLRVPAWTLATTLGRTVIRLIPALAAIFCMLALGFVTKYSGMDIVLGLAFTRTGPILYPVFGTLLGWLGVALTGSDTSSNVLFGNLQRVTAEKLGLNPILMASANTTGGVMGKMIDAQSIVVAAAATGEGGHEGALLRAVFGHSVALALLVGAIVWVYAHVFPGAVAAPALLR
jgi:lactate permease